MANLSAATRARVEELKEKYKLSEKAARFVDVTLENPHLPMLTRARGAGYGESGAKTDGYKRLKTPKIEMAVRSESEKMLKAQETVEEIKKDGRGWVRKQLAYQLQDPDVNPNHIRIVELVGKQEGAFIERIELDAGEHTRRRLAQDFLKD